MTHYWMIITAGKRITLTSKVYKVAVSYSKQGIVELGSLQQWCAAHGYYCHIWDNEAVIFLSKIAESLSVTIKQLNVLMFRARELVRSLKQTNRLPVSDILSPNGLKILHDFNAERAQIRKINVLLTAEAEQRKKPKAESDRPKSLSPLKSIKIPADGVQE